MIREGVSSKDMIAEGGSNAGMNTDDRENLSIKNPRKPILFERGSISWNQEWIQ